MRALCKATGLQPEGNVVAMRNKKFSTSLVFLMHQRPNLFFHFSLFFFSAFKQGFILTAVFYGCVALLAEGH